MKHSTITALQRTLGLAGLLVLAGCGGGDAEIDTGSPPPARLGAHVLFSHHKGGVDTPFVAPPISTQTQGSTLVVVGLRQRSALPTPWDTFHNQWWLAHQPARYSSDDLYTAAWIAPDAVGGAGQLLTFDTPEFSAAPASVTVVEVANAGPVRHVFRAAPATDESPGSLYVDGPATLIAVWGGGSPRFGEQAKVARSPSAGALPDSGFRVIASAVPDRFDAPSIPMVVAVKEVEEAGTYSVRWTSSPAQGCACYLIAVRSTKDVTHKK